MKPLHEHIQHEIDSSIHAFIYQESNFHTLWHYHNEFELSFIQKSSGIRHVGNSIDNFTAGDLVLIGKNVPHCWKNENDYKGGVVSACVQWNQDHLEPILRNIPEFKQITKLLDIAKSGISFTNINFNNRIGKQLMELPKLPPDKRLITFLAILSDLNDCKDKELLSVEGNQYQFSEESDHRTKAILDYIETNYQDKISIEEMADITHMTAGAFCKYFKKQFNRSFTNYLNEFRIRKTCILLQDTDEKLSEISYKCGYENMSFFHRQFKKYMHMTPHEYRKKVYYSLHPFSSH